MRKEERVERMDDLFDLNHFIHDWLQSLRESSHGDDLAVFTCRNLTDMAQLEAMFCQLMLLVAALFGISDG